MAKELIYSEDARKKLFSGIKQIADAVKVTLGPAGRFVLIEKKGWSPTITKDGVSVAKEVDLLDPVENLGANLLREVASKTNDTAGDNTTTATVLGYAIVREGLKSLSAGMRPIDLKRGIDKAAIDVVDALVKNGKTVETAKEITDVATISANNDAEIGKILAEVIEKVGKDGVITVEDSNNYETKVKIANGLQFNNGWINPMFSTNKERLTVEWDQPSKILITDKKLSGMQELLPILEANAQTGSPLTIICDDCEGEALNTLLVNSLRGTLKVAVVKAPQFGDNRDAILQDIAIMTGGTVISEKYGTSLGASTTLDMLGTAKVKITKETTTLTSVDDTYKDAINARIEELKGQLNVLVSEYDKNKVKKRIAALSGGVAIVEVGAITESEMKEKKFRVEDTIAATKAALEEGIVPGGGVALVNAVSSLSKKFKSDSADEMRGYDILLSAVSEPLKQIADNAGVNGDVVLNNILTKNVKGYGYNAKTGVYGDMIEFGVIDTVKALKNALLNAASVAGMILTTECAITFAKEKEQPQMCQTPMGPMPY